MTNKIFLANPCAFRVGSAALVITMKILFLIRWKALT
jgi:hypothetical protein